MVIALSFKIELINHTFFVFSKDDFIFVIGKQQLEFTFFRFKFFNARNLHVGQNAVTEFTNNIVIRNFKNGEIPRNCRKYDKVIRDEHSSHLSFVYVVYEFIVLRSLYIKRRNGSTRRKINQLYFVIATQSAQSRRGNVRYLVGIPVRRKK